MTIAGSLLLSLLGSSDSLVLCTAKGDRIELDSLCRLADTCYCVFYTDYSCADCYEQLLTRLQTGRSHNRVLLLARTEPSANTRLLCEKRLRKSYPVDGIVFEDSDPEDTWPPSEYHGGLFGRYSVTKGPALLIVTRRERKFLSNEELFGKRKE
jgi:hypothetical protein